MAETGIAFRFTVGYVTDGSGDAMPAELGATATYPETLSNGLTVGWEASTSGVDSRDRSTSVNVRLAGIHYNISSTEQVLFRVDVTAAAYNIRAAFGDPTYAAADAYFQFRDNTTAFATINHSGGNPAAQWYDASDVLRTSSALWASNNVRISRTFASSIFRLAMGRGAGATGSCVVAYLSVESSGAAGTVASRRKKLLIHPGAGPGGFGTKLRTRRNNTAPSTLATITGTVNSTNANDTLAANGGVVKEGSRRGKIPNHPGSGPYNFTHFRRAIRNTVFPTVTGSVAYANANDTLAAAGSPKITGSSSTTNANDTLAASGAPKVTGTLAKTNANDTLAASGSPRISGSLATTNANDSLSASGSPVVSGTLAKTNADDTLAASGTSGSAVTGTVNYTNANDTLSANGSPKITGSLATTNANDTLAASGAPKVTGTLARTNANDSLSAAGTPKVTGSASTTNANDSLSASGTAGSITGTAAIANANDTLAASGFVGTPVVTSASPNDSQSPRRKPHNSLYTVQERGQQAYDKALVEAAIAEAEATQAPIEAAKATQSSPVNQAQEAAYAAALRQLEDDEEAFSLIMELV